MDLFPLPPAYGYIPVADAQKSSENFRENKTLVVEEVCYEPFKYLMSSGGGGKLVRARDGLFSCTRIKNQWLVWTNKIYKASFSRVFGSHSSPYKENLIRLAKSPRNVHHSCTGCATDSYIRSRCLRQLIVFVVPTFAAAGEQIPPLRIWRGRWSVNVDGLPLFAVFVESYVIWQRSFDILLIRRLL